MTKKQTVIKSSVLEKDPTFLPLVIEFTEYLPGKVETIIKLYKEKKWDELEREAHNLVISGSYGFDDLSDYALELEEIANSQKDEEAKLCIVKIEDYVSRIEKI